MSSQAIIANHSSQEINGSSSASTAPTNGHKQPRSAAQQEASRRNGTKSKV